MFLNNQDISVPTAITEVTAIDLTLAGQIELMQFSHEAIKFANMRMLKSPVKDNPFPYFFKLCHIFHQEHNIATAPEIVEEIQKKYGISKSEKKVNSNGRAKGYTIEIPQDTRNKEFTRKPATPHYENTHTDEEYRKVMAYHQRLRPHEYVTTSTGEFERKAPHISLEEELTLPPERIAQNIEALDADWESAKGEHFKHMVGMKTALDLYGRLRMQLSTGKLWPDMATENKNNQ